MKIVVIYMDFLTEEHQKTLTTVKDVLGSCNCDYSLIHRDKVKTINFSGFNIAIVIGGDGTFLRTSHFIDDTPILGINSDVNKKEGFFMQTNRLNFKTDLLKIQQKKYKIKQTTRLEVWKNDLKLPELSLNEVYIGSKHPYNMSRYNLKVKGLNENQKSSGILIGTPSGSNAWIKSAGGKVIDKGFEYLVREPYDRRLTFHELKQGILEDSEKIIIKSMMKDGIIMIDSLSEEYDFIEGDKVVINVGLPLSYIELN